MRSLHVGRQVEYVLDCRMSQLDSHLIRLLPPSLCAFVLGCKSIDPLRDRGVCILEFLDAAARKDFEVRRDSGVLWGSPARSLAEASWIPVRC